MTLLDRLKENSDEKLKIFNARLTPSVASERILGVRSPVVKALAKEFYGSGEASLFLSQTPHFYLEENNLHGCLLCNIKDLDAALAMTEEFLPFIDNWATNDITAMGMKIFSRNTSAVRGGSKATKLIPCVSALCVCCPIFSARRLKKAT